jgi:hypothetical protein
MKELQLKVIGGKQPDLDLWRQTVCWTQMLLRWKRYLEDMMLWTIFVILLVLWLLGLVSSYTLGGYIHLLLVIALVVLILQLISGRRPVV